MKNAKQLLNWCAMFGLQSTIVIVVHLILPQPFRHRVQCTSPAPPFRIFFAMDQADKLLVLRVVALQERRPVLVRTRGQAARLLVMRLVALQTRKPIAVRMLEQENKARFLLVMQLVAMQARLHGNYARVRLARPNLRQVRGDNVVATDLMTRRARSQRLTAYHTQACNY
jgi:hypothetical protein